MERLTKRFDGYAHGAEGGKSRREIIWMNYRQDMQMPLEDFPEIMP